MDRFIRAAFVAVAVFAAHAAHAELYGRLDVGYSKATDAGIKDKNFDLDGLICGGDASCPTGGELNNVGESPVLGAGIGWRFGRSVRADLSFAYRDGYRLDDTDAGSKLFRADIKSTNVMLAGYYDFGADRLRPYLGAGAGWARNKIGPITTTSAGLTEELPGGTWSGFAWSVMAGLGVRLVGSVTFDLGYRYVDLGKIETQSADLAPGVTYSGASGKLRAHEISLGVRF